MKGMMLYPKPVAASVAAAFGRQMPGLIGVLRDRREPIDEETLRELAIASRACLIGIATLDQYRAGMRKLDEGYTYVTYPLCDGEGKAHDMDPDTYVCRACNKTAELIDDENRALERSMQST